jgi:hypothetical protein
MHAGHTGGDRRTVRGMRIVGESRMYLSHLPMFHPPQDCQVLEVELNRYVFDDPADVSWHATWGLRDDGVATEDSSEDLAELFTRRVVAVG